MNSSFEVLQYFIVTYLENDLGPDSECKNVACMNYQRPGIKCTNGILTVVHYCKHYCYYFIVYYTLLCNNLQR